MSQVTVLTGAIWGIAGAIAMMIVMQAGGGDTPPPFAVFWAKFIGNGDPSNAMPQSLILHALYALVAGAAYAVIFNNFDLGFSITTITGGVIWGVVWGLVLLIGAAVFWVNLVLDMDPDPSQMLPMAIAHLAYGVVLGLLAAVVPHLL